MEFSTTSLLADDGLPYGYYFQPTERELLDHYLKNNLLGTMEYPKEVVPTVDGLFSTSPDQFPFHSCFRCKEPDWYFFTTRLNSKNKGDPFITKDGYYEFLSKEEEEILNDEGTAVLGFKSTLEFYHGQPPDGTESDWLVQQYRLNPAALTAEELIIATPEKVSNFVACKVVDKRWEKDSDGEWIQNNSRDSGENVK